MSKPITKPICHPDRRTHAKGLCVDCYHKEWNEKNPDRVKKWVKGLAKAKATCHPDRTVHGNGLCKSCYWTQWRKDNKEKQRGYKRKSLLKNTYGMTLDEYNVLLEAQNYGCAICGNSNGNRVMFVDHDHDTSEVRGLLCTRCNCAIGLLDDDVEKMAKAIEYITGTTVTLSALFSKEV
jgi:hypothetical protein